MKVDLMVAYRGLGLDRLAHQAEADGAGPDRSCHASLSTPISVDSAAYLELPVDVTGLVGPEAVWEAWKRCP